MRRNIGVVTLTVVDEPGDRPQWISETIRLVTAESDRQRSELLARVAAATDDDLARGTEDDWGLGQVAVHLLLIDRGVALIALRLALGQSAVGGTGQPRPAGRSGVRTGILMLAEKTAAAHARLLTLHNHYDAHLRALDEGTPSAL